jgi:two-component sensor histidine kinase/HAMP domain-containing protein
MRFLHNIPIKYKLIVIILSVTLLITGLGFSFGVVYYERHLRNDFVDNMEINARLIGEYCITPLVFGDAAGAERVLKKLDTIPMVTNGIVYSDAKNIFASYKKGTDTFYPPFPVGKAVHMFHGDYLHVLQPIVYENVSYGYIYLAGSLEPLAIKIHSAYRFMAVLLAILLGLTYLLALMLQRFISDPILKLAAVTEHISNEADLSFRISTKGSDEIGILYDGFNSMLEQLHLRQIERDRAEEEIKSSLREKEVMLKEIHHRVKNNLQLVSSLLSLQSNHVQDEKALAMFVDCQNRVRSMALVHEKLYHSPDLASINFADYVNALISGLQASYSAQDRIKFDIDILDIPLAIDRAVPCGLLIHELVSNSMKHAFTSDYGGLIQIMLRKNGEMDRFSLSIRDNGKGIPDHIDFRNTDSLGLRLAVILAEKQLGGSIDLDRKGGTAFTIQF